MLLICGICYILLLDTSACLGHAVGLHKLKLIMYRKSLMLWRTQLYSLHMLPYGGNVTSSQRN